MTKKRSTQRQPSAKSSKLKAVRDLAVNAAAAGLSTGAATAALGTSASAAGVVAALTVVFQTAPALASAAYSDWRRERHEAWFAGWLLGTGSTNGEARDEFLEKIKEPGVREAIFDHFRRIELALDEAALPLLGRLAREYARAGRKPDVFFRNATGFLAELDASMVEGLALLCAGVARTAGAAPRVLLRVGESGKIANALLPDAPVFSHTKSITGEAEDPANLGAIPAVFPLFDALRRHGIGQAGFGGYYDTVSGPHVVIVEPATLARLGAIVGAPATT